jgi:hypothetical protein
LASSSNYPKLETALLSPKKSHLDHSKNINTKMRMKTKGYSLQLLKQAKRRVCMRIKASKVILILKILLKN